MHKQAFQKILVIFRKARKEVSKTLAEAVSELWAERAAALKLIELTEQTHYKQDQQQL